MSMSNSSSTNLDLTQNSSSPTKLPKDDGFNLQSFAASKDAAKLAAWVKQEYTRAKQARTQRQLQWYTNMAFFYGQQWVEKTGGQYPLDFQSRLTSPRKGLDRKVINRTRAFVRSELAQFLSAIPNAVAVPATAEDEDVRAAYAAEQAWSSISETQKLRYHFSRAMWWTTVTGNGFIKTWWDQDAIDKVSGQQGAIRYGAVTPFHLFVPDLREQDIDDQPYIINAYVKPLSWCYRYFGDALKDIDLQPSVSSGNQLVEEGYLNLGSGTSQSPALDSVIVYETWAKPGAHKFLPEGGVIISIDDVVVSMTRNGLPYNHGQYPFTKFEHIPTSTFYGDSPLVDLNPLQKEYNTLRSQISDAGNRMAKPQLVAQKGSIVPSKMTNESGLVIEYKAGFAAPQPLALSPLPQYYVDQQERVLTDMEDIGGQHDVSRGQAPAGVTAGTAISFLQEADNSYRTPQYQNIEDGYSRIAQQTIENFVQFVDIRRKIKTIGADGSFDTMLLTGADLKNGTDIRIQQGSSIGVSKAAQDARIMDMFGMGLIDQPLALRLLEVGGAQKILDIMQVAERKAQRENIKMKMIAPQELMMAQQQFDVQQQMAQMQDPMGLDQMPPVEMPPLVVADDFDLHEKHIEVHNTFRMSQEYEILSPELKAQFEKHIQMHEQFLQQQQMQQMVMQAQMGAPAPEQGPGATMSGNGQVPDMTPNPGA